MFIMFQFFVIYFIILGYSNTLLTNHDGTTPFSLERQVEVELSPFTQIVQFLEHPPAQIPPNEFLKLGIQLKSQLKMFAQRLVNAEMEVKMLLINRGGLEKELKDDDKYKILLALTRRVDDLERSFHPARILSGDRFSRWKTIFNLNTPMVEELRNKVTAAGMTEEMFCRKVQMLCNERNDRASHSCIELPTTIDERSIQEALLLMKIPADETTKDAVRILISPFKSGDLISTKK